AEAAAAQRRGYPRAEQKEDAALGGNRIAGLGERGVIDVSDHRPGRSLARNLGEKCLAEARRHLGTATRRRRLEAAEWQVGKTEVEILGAGIRDDERVTGSLLRVCGQRGRKGGKPTRLGCAGALEQLGGGGEVAVVETARGRKRKTLGQLARRRGHTLKSV